jgi:hypothetical protein
LCIEGAEAVEFIVNHAEVSIAFAQGTKLPLVLTVCCHLAFFLPIFHSACPLCNYFAD